MIAANRDEFYDRPATGPQTLVTEPHVVGGRDERAGGTWLAFSEQGVFLGLTNQRSFSPRDDSLHSRGALVDDALRTGTFDGITRYLESIDAREFNEFNLIFGDGDRARAAYGRRDDKAVELETLAPGVHVLCNDRLGSPDFPKADEARARVASLPSESWAPMKVKLVEVLSDRSLPDLASLPPLPPNSPFDAEVARRLQAICVETPVYGTVSATVAALGSGRVDHYAFCDGPPDRAPFEDVVHLMRSA